LDTTALSDRYYLAGEGARPREIKYLAQVYTVEKVQPGSSLSAKGKESHLKFTYCVAELL
jgi:hypothetical protein